MGYAFDASTIDLWLALFPWARFRRHKGALKPHTLLDLRGSIPCFVDVTEWKTPEVTVLDTLVMERVPVAPGGPDHGRAARPEHPAPGAKSAHRYPAPLRRIPYRDAEKGRRIFPLQAEVPVFAEVQAFTRFHPPCRTLASNVGAGLQTRPRAELKLGPYEHLVLDRANGVQVPWPGYPFRPA
jgi:hypothetical protein